MAAVADEREYGNLHNFLVEWLVPREVENACPMFSINQAPKLYAEIAAAVEPIEAREMMIWDSAEKLAESGKGPRAIKARRMLKHIEEWLRTILDRFLFVPRSMSHVDLGQIVDENLWSELGEAFLDDRIPELKKRLQEVQELRRVGGPLFLREGRGPEKEMVGMIGNYLTSSSAKQLEAEEFEDDEGDTSESE